MSGGGGPGPPHELGINAPSTQGASVAFVGVEIFQIHYNNLYILYALNTLPLL